MQSFSGGAWSHGCIEGQQFIYATIAVQDRQGTKGIQPYGLNPLGDAAAAVDLSPIRLLSFEISVSTPEKQHPASLSQTLIGLTRSTIAPSPICILPRHSVQAPANG